MNTLITTDIAPNKELPIKNGTIDFIQNAWKEIARLLARALGSNVLDIASTGTALKGCNNVGNLTNYDINPGLVYYGGELYLLDAAVFTVGGGQTAVCTINTSYDTSAATDPVEFTNGSFHNVHEIKKIVVTSAASGSGTFDYSTLTFINPAENTNTITISHANWSAGSTLSLVRNPNGLITMTGAFDANGSGALNDIICTLPSGWRPAATTYIDCAWNTGTATDLQQVLVQIITNGEVRITHRSSGVTIATGYAVLDGKSFYKAF